MKLVSIVLSIIVFINTSIVNSVDEKHDFDLLEYCLSHQISSQSEFNDVLMCYCGVEEDDLFVPKNEVSFQIIVDISEMMICTIVMEVTVRGFLRLPWRERSSTMESYVRVLLQVVHLQNLPALAGQVYRRLAPA